MSEVHLNTGHADTLHPCCGTYLGAGGSSTSIISKVTCYACIQSAAERCRQRIYEIAYQRGRKFEATERQQRESVQNRDKQE